MRRSDVVEEHYLDRPLDVEADLDEGEGDYGLPWQPEDIRVSSRNFSLRNVIDMIEERELELAPDFQRNRVWKLKQKSGLIESILLQIPLPAFYFAQDKDGSMKVIDGLQRLSTAYGFRKGEFALGPLEYLDLEGRRFDDLSPLWRRRFNQTQLSVHVIDPQTPSQIRYDIFKRINTGGTPLNAQEIRHCLTTDRCREFLQRCAARPEFLTAVGKTFRDHVRMADRELVLRFCAFRLQSLEEYRAMDPFLDDAAALLDDVERLTAKDLNILERDFARAMATATEIFGPRPFRKSQSSPLNRPMFESLSVTLAKAADKRRRPDAAHVAEGVQHLVEYDRTYYDAISSSTGGRTKVHYRFAAARKLVFEP
ncbi:hypothetical protein GCM10022254_03270 [Actinomadura meridiana]|uniref:GmrSD restriction endonucleases N-terminal domain-containing protein n=1 Tax=Actinomadura meridiana TaxID=559626 RepID=A0ABP8BS11_9ACTN